jgi:GH25 family lysozyme M1 (1,4-beta-N-acetylmuramidase)
VNRTTPLLLACALLSAVPSAFAQRSRGIDVSSWQGSTGVSQTNWNTIRSTGNDFAFIRSTRGGTTGTYNQSDPNNNLGGNTLSQSFTDTAFVNNITRARAAGLFAGPYHFSRPDILTYTLNGSTVLHTGTDEANHMLNVAGDYMSLGYMRPVYDLEAGASERNRTALTDFSLAFISRIRAVKGIDPIVYVNSSYANSEVDSRLNVYDLWMARYIDPAVVNVQTSVDPTPASSLPNVYGVWAPNFPTMPNPRPWDFWQYTASGSQPGISGNCDLNVANGDREFVKDFLVPALWQSNAAGNWSTAANWNGNAVQALPGPNDRVILDRPGVSVTVTLSTGTHSIRSLQLNETLNITGGSLAVEQFVRSQFSTLTVSGGSLTAASMQNEAVLNQSGTSQITISGPVTGAGLISLNGGTFTAPRVRQQELNLFGGTLRLTNAANASTLERLFIGVDPATQQRGRLDLGTATLVLPFTGPNTETIIRDTLAQNAPDADSRYTIGYIRVRSLLAAPYTFGDLNLPADSMILRRTLKGDANLDGTVNFSDLLALAQNYDRVGFVWSLGDFDYDGNVNFSDLLALAQNYDRVAGTFETDWAMAQAMVPEPATVGLLAGAGLMLTRHRRRRR